MIYKTGSFRVCGDCLVWLANGDATGMSDDKAQAVQAGERAMVEQYGQTHVSHSDAHDEPAGACECCGDYNARPHTVETYTTATGRALGGDGGGHYIDPRFIVSAAIVEPNHSGAGVDGYGSKIRTRYMVDCADNRRRRVYAISFSNAGTLYVNVKGERLMLCADAELKLENAKGV